MYTNTLRMTGMSGIDTQSIVEQLMRVESFRYTKLQQRNQSIIWQQELYRGVSSTLRGFQDSFLTFGNSNNLKSVSTFRNNISTLILSNGTISNHAKIIGNSNAIGDFTLAISQLAQKQSYGSGVVGNNIKGNASLNLDNLQADDSFNITLDGITKTIKFSQEDIDTIKAGGEDTLTNILNEKLRNEFGVDPTSEGGAQKITAALDKGVLSFEVTSGHEMKITNISRNISVEGVNPTTVIEEGEDSKSLTINVAGEDITFEVTDGMSAADIAKAINAELANTKKDGVALSQLVSVSATDGTLKFTAKTTSENVNITGDGLSFLGFTSDVVLGATNVLNDLGIENNATSNLDTNKTLGEVFEGAFTNSDEISFTIGGVDFNFSKDTTISEMLKEINSSDAGVTLSYSTTSKSFTLESKEFGSINAFGIEGNFLTETLGFKEVTEAQDSIFTFNGVTTSRYSNNVTIDDVELELLRVTPEDEVINISISQNVDEVKGVIKGFVEEYNKLIDLLEDLTTQQRPKYNGKFYEPLTDEEKQAMTEYEISAYEAKAKVGILRGDSILNDTIRELRNMMSEGLILEDGTRLSLSQIGISTKAFDGSYAGAKLEIDEEKLDKALAENPEGVTELFSRMSSIDSNGDRNERMKDNGIAYRLDEIINSTIKAEGSIGMMAGEEGKLISESNNFLYNQIKNNETALTRMFEELRRKEERYYAIFARVEQTIIKNDNMMSYLQSTLV